MLRLERERRQSAAALGDLAITTSAFSSSSSTSAKASKGTNKGTKGSSNISSAVTAAAMVPTAFGPPQQQQHLLQRPLLRTAHSTVAHTARELALNQTRGESQAVTAEEKRRRRR